MRPGDEHLLPLRVSLYLYPMPAIPGFHGMEETLRRNVGMNIYTSHFHLSFLPILYPMTIDLQESGTASRSIHVPHRMLPGH